MGISIPTVATRSREIGPGCIVSHTSSADEPLTSISIKVVKAAITWAAGASVTLSSRVPKETASGVGVGVGNAVAVGVGVILAMASGVVEEFGDREGSDVSTGVGLDVTGTITASEVG